jgi:hypothetical protein
MSEFTSAAVKRIFGLKRDCLQQWIDRGYVSPSIHKSDKQGDPNIFALEDLYSLGIFQKLSDRGFSRSSASRYARALKEKLFSQRKEASALPAQWGEGVFIFKCFTRTSDPDWFGYVAGSFRRTEEALVNLRELASYDADEVHIFNISAIIALVDEKIRMVIP